MLQVLGRWAGGQVAPLSPGQSVTSQHWRYLSPNLVSFAIIVGGGETKRKRAQSENFLKERMFL